MGRLSSLAGSRWAPALAALPGVAVLCAHWAAVRPAFVDDSYIFYRYAENWADGLGLVFNRGEHVEGYSSFLWTALLALEHAAGLSLPTAAPALGLVTGAGCLVVAAYMARSVLGGTVASAAVPLALGLCTPLAYYAANGMDAPLFALVLTAAVAAAAAHVNEPTRARTVVLAVALIALVLVRAEGFAFVLLLAAGTLALERRRGRVALVAPLVAVAATVAVFAVRVAVYGALLPATVTAKGYFGHVVSEGKLRSVAHVIRTGLNYEGAILLVALALVALAIGVAWRRQRIPPPLVLLAALAVALNVTVTVLNSGDWMGNRRLLAPALPLAAILIPWALQALTSVIAPTRRHARMVAVVAGCALVVAAAGVSFGGQPTDPDLVAIGQALAKADPAVRVLTNEAGVVPYYAGSRTYAWDILGLTDAHNARQGQFFFAQYGRTDPRYDFSRPFDVLVTNAPLDPALMVAEWNRTPARFDRYVMFAPARWARKQLLVFARRGAPVEGLLAAACRCRSIRLSPRVRATLVARAGGVQAIPRVDAPAPLQRPFAPASFWNAPLRPDAPIDPRSAAYVADLQRQVRRFGPWINTSEYSTPVYTVPAGQRRVPVRLGEPRADLQAALRRVPIPPLARPAAGTDGSMVVWQPSKDTMWELWRAVRRPDGWHARFGGRIEHLSRNPGHYTQPPSWGATATSLPFLGGLIRIGELQQRHIDHALALAIPQAKAGVFSWPAQRTDGTYRSAAAIPEGTRFRIDPRLDLGTIQMSPVVRAMAEAAQRYGIVVRDGAGSVAFYAEDPTPTGADPYGGPSGFFGDTRPSDLLAQFPWGHLQALRTRLSNRPY